MQNDINIIQSICSDLKASIDDLIYHIVTMKKEIEAIKEKIK